MKRQRQVALNDRQTLSLYHGDLTDATVDAIVNAANNQLAHGGGVAGAMVARGGASIQRESTALAPVPTGQAVITGAGRLPAQFIIHAVGPRGSDPNADALLHAAVTSALTLAHQRGLVSIALPAISTGIFGFPKDRGATIITQALVNFCQQHPTSALTDLRVVLIDRSSVDIFDREWQSRWPQS